MKNVMPFLFHIPKDREGVLSTLNMKPVEQNEFHVVVASFGYSPESTAWMTTDESLGKECLVPSVDLEKEHHTFATEQEALQFIAEWWRKQI